jgi:hypothetical protein
MRPLLIGLAGVLSVVGQTHGQVLLYRETFPYPGLSGNFSVSTVGWANDVLNNPGRLYQVSGGDGAMVAFQNAARTTAFYTSTVLSAATGATFPSINPALYSGITFSADIEPYPTPANVTARFAVQMNGGSWFVSTNTLPVPGTVGPFATYSNVFHPTASKWDSLSVSGNGTGSSATIGPVVSSDLTGNITGAGLVFTHTGTGGTFNFDNFLITAANVGNLAVGSISNGMVSLSWPAALNVQHSSGCPRFPSADCRTVILSPATLRRTGRVREIPLRLLCCPATRSPVHYVCNKAILFPTRCKRINWSPICPTATIN